MKKGELLGKPVIKHDILILAIYVLQPSCSLLFLFMSLSSLDLGITFFFPFHAFLFVARTASAFFEWEL